MGWFNTGQSDEQLTEEYEEAQQNATFGRKHGFDALAERGEFAMSAIEKEWTTRHGKQDG